MWETVVVGIIVILCLVLTGRAFYREASGRSTCGSCGSAKQGCRGGCDAEGLGKARKRVDKLWAAASPPRRR